MSPKPNPDRGGYGSFAGSAWSASQLRASSDLIWLIPSPRGLAGRLWRKAFRAVVSRAGRWLTNCCWTCASESVDMGDLLVMGTVPLPEQSVVGLDRPEA